MNHPNGRIVVGDGSDASLDALRWALRQAELTSCDLEAVTSWSRPGAPHEITTSFIGYEAHFAG